MTVHHPPLLGIVAHSGTGKTTLLKKLIPKLSSTGLNIAVIKHTHHSVELDTVGKDSYQLRKSGAKQTMIVSKGCWALINETIETYSMTLQFLAKKFDRTDCDLILVEGFKGEKIPKIALHRQETKSNINECIDKYVIALACDQKIIMPIPVLDLNNTDDISNFIIHWYHNQIIL